MQSEMSHAHIHFKGRLGELRRRLGDDENSGESSISSSEYEDLPHFPSSQTSTTATTTTTTTTTPSSFTSTLRSFSHRQFDPENDVAVPSHSNLSSRRRGWLTFKSSSSSSMATPDDDLSLYQPREMTRKKLTGKQKREELEREVSTLQKLLSNERKVHEILENAHNRKDGSPIVIPNFLPPKMKELLAEIAMVEGEIARLQSQIRELQNSLDQEKEVTRKSKNKQGQFEMSMSGSYCLLPSPPNATLTQRGTSTPERLSFETKALHFISKAIKGDYNLNNFSVNDKMGSPRELSEQKENRFREEVGFQEKVPRKSGLLKPPSPLRDPRNPTPMPRERISEVFFDPPSKPVSLLFQPEDICQKWQPNKLSEGVMKCLLFIFVRLIRISKTIELEKSGPISRSNQYSLSSASFRVDASLNPKASPLSQKDSRQQDPYGIFDMEESIPRDIGPYKNLVRFTSSSLDPKCISNSNSILLLQKLRVLLNNLQKVDLRSLTYEQKLAFWINMYNACIMHGYLQYGVPSSPEKLLTLMNKATLNVGGNIVNAQAIEHFILRKQATSVIEAAYWKGEKDDKEAIIRELYGVEPFNPNVTFALCCGTRSSPAVKVYTAEGVVAELEKSKLEYLQASIVVASTKRIAVPELLFRNMLDFAQDTDSLVKWVCHQLPTSGSLRKSMVDFYRSHNTGKISNSIESIPYEFEFRYLLSV